MQSQASSRFPRVVRRETEHAGLDELGYVKVAVFLAIVTAIEVGIYYLDLPTGLFIAILVVLASIKFATVAALFMHLRFDGKLLAIIFCFGIALMAVVALVVITTTQHSSRAPTKSASTWNVGYPGAEPAIRAT